MADIIATEAQAKQVGGSSISIIANKMCTQARAIECKCKNVNYPSNRLIPFNLLVRNVINLGTIKLSGQCSIFMESPTNYIYSANAKATIVNGNIPGKNVIISVAFKGGGATPCKVTIPANSSTGSGNYNYKRMFGTTGSYPVATEASRIDTEGFTCTFTK